MSIAILTRVQALEQRVDELVRALQVLVTERAELVVRVQKLEDKRGPGRPPKQTNG